MNAVDPPRKLRALSAESRIIRRGVLGDRVDDRSREGRFLSQIERELTRQVSPLIGLAGCRYSLTIQVGC